MTRTPEELQILCLATTTDLRATEIAKRLGTEVLPTLELVQALENCMEQYHVDALWGVTTEERERILDASKYLTQQLATIDTDDTGEVVIATAGEETVDLAVTNAAIVLANKIKTVGLTTSNPDTLHILTTALCNIRGTFIDVDTGGGNFESLLKD